MDTALLISGCVGISLLVAIIISSLVGTLVPLLFHKINIDPAVASGPLITTVNDLVAVVTYYGLAWLLLIEIFQVFLFGDFAFLIQKAKVAGLSAPSRSPSCRQPHPAPR